MGALFLLIIAAILLSFGEGSGRDSSGTNPDQVLFHGIIPVLVASVRSGLASSLCQWASQVKKHNSCLMIVEMPIVGSLSVGFFFLLVGFSGEETQLMLHDCGNVYSWNLCLLASMSKSPDGEAIRQHGFFHGWTALTMMQYLIRSQLVCVFCGD
ncbi:UDP-N-acetylglucosamine transporter ROCK1-like [Magnolia sinica]|uniref:UDP-N-acetylglucosamine transporter ROCK1-like n=1 Tax=Magnolia sinica TaxID=86752 RepID=UPI00265A663C|nr:UDP-N-acetylglucosamine transporter ROCK1-like [Magnolia sinica]